MHRIEPRADQESVWDYPRPPRVESTGAHVVIWLAEEIVADTRRAVRVLETSHPPVYYIPRADFAEDSLFPAEGSSFCEFKGAAKYLSIRTADVTAKRSAWYYPNPSPGYEALVDHVAVYPAAMDSCEVDGEIVSPQAGGFYGGWITSSVVGPFKGEPGTTGW